MCDKGEEVNVKYIAMIMLFFVFGSCGKSEEIQHAKAIVIRSLPSQTVYDRKTDLMWEDTQHSIDRLKEWRWFTAIDYCENLVLEGHDDWRLPNINELYSMYNVRDQFRHRLEPYDSTVRGYWSSTDIRGQKYFFIPYGNILMSVRYSSADDRFNVRCVR